MRLQKVETTVEHANIFAPPALAEHFWNKAVRHIELTLRPTFSLRPRLRERQRLLVVNNRVVRPSRLQTFGQRLHRELHVFRQARGAPAVLFQNVESYAHARSAEHRRQTEIRFCQVRHVIDNPKSNRKSSRNPSVVGIFRVEEALNNFVALAKAIIHFH